jgi:hypothetical protein
MASEHSTITEHSAPDEHGTATAHRAHRAPSVVTPTTRVNLALPFSRITVEEPGKDLAELAAIVASLAAAVERTATEPGLPELRMRADALVARLRR